MSIFSLSYWPSGAALHLCSQPKQPITITRKSTHKFIAGHNKNRPREQGLYSAQNDEYNQSNTAAHGTDADPDPDPDSGSGSGSGSRSFYHQAKLVRKTLIPTFL
jgi:hypothetical protein